MPTLTDVWDFLVGFKQATEAGFARIELRLDPGERDVAVRVAQLKANVAQLKADVAQLQGDVHRLERRIIRTEDRLAAIESAEYSRQLVDHERRISRLEQLSI